MFEICSLWNTNQSLSITVNRNTLTCPSPSKKYWRGCTTQRWNLFFL